MTPDIEKGLEYDFYNNEEGFVRKEPESFKEIVLRGIETCRKEMSKELTIGKTTIIQKGGVNIPVVIPDQRKVVESCVKQLYDLLLFFFDEKANENLPALEEEIDKLEEKFLNMYLEVETYVPHIQYAKKYGAIHPSSALGANFDERRENLRVKLYRKMYQELILLFKRKRDLSNKIIVR